MSSLAPPIVSRVLFRKPLLVRYASDHKRSWYQRVLRKGGILKGGAGPSWKETKIESTQEWDLTARKLKEVLIAFSSRQLPDAAPIKDLLFELVHQSPGPIPITYLPIVEAAYGSLSRASISLTDLETNQLYKAIASNDAHNIVRYSIVTKLYAKLGQSSDKIITEVENWLENGLLYCKFLRAQLKMNEYDQLFRSLLSTNGTISNNELILEFVEEIGESESKKGLGYLENVLKASSNPTPAVYVRAIDVYVKLVTGSENADNRLSSFVENVLFPSHKPDQPISADIAVSLIDSAISLNASNAGQKILANIIMPHLEDLLQTVPNMDTKLQFYELMLMACTRLAIDKKIGDKISGRIYDEYSRSEFEKETWEILVSWSLVKDLSLSEMKSCLSEMRDNGYNPDCKTLNGILHTAYALDTPDTIVDKALSYFSADLNIEGDLETFALRMEHVLSKDRSSDAAELFQQSLQKGCQWDEDDGKYLSTLDNLLVKIDKTDTFFAFRLYKRVKMFTKTVGYDARCSLLNMFLKGGYIADAGMFLEEEFADGDPEKSTSDSISADGVPELYRMMYDYIMASEDYQQAWLLFGYMNRFIKLPYGSYYPIMQKFCQLQRPDASLAIFKFMRARHLKEGMSPPNADIYVLLFDEFGRTFYEEGVLTLHTYFKMDLCIEAETRILNSIMGAYCNLLDDPRTMEQWRQLILGNQVDNDSVTIMIKHFTRASLADVEELWTTLPDLGLQPSRDNLRQYVIANCYNGYYLRALNIVKNMEQDYGLLPDGDTIEALYNWTMVSHRKEQVKAWALENHAEEWHALESRGTLKTYVLPENNENASEESLRAEAISKIESPEVAKNRYLPGEEE